MTDTATEADGADGEGEGPDESLDHVAQLEGGAGGDAGRLQGEAAQHGLEQQVGVGLAPGGEPVVGRGRRR